MGYVINYENVNGIFAVPTSVADRHLRLCGEMQLKVLLLVLRGAPAAADPAEISRRLSLSEGEVCDCLLYWTSAGVLRDDPAEKAPCRAGVSASASPEIISEAPSRPAPTIDPPPIAPLRTVETAPTGQTVTVVHSRAKLTPGQINAMAESDDRLPELLRELQRQLGKALSPGENESIAWMYGICGLSPEYLLLAAQYCSSIGKGRVRYLEQLVAGWLEKGVDSYAAAEVEVARLQAQAENEKTIRTMFGLGTRELSTREKESIALWFDVYRTPPELIRMAYERTVDNTGKASFAYLGKILAKWHEKGIVTPEAAAADLSSKPAAARTGEDYNTDDVRRRMEKRLFGE